MKIISLLSGCLVFFSSANGQADPFDKHYKDLDSIIKVTDNEANVLLTPAGFNIFLQRKALNYLTGTSDLTLAKFYATYTTDNDKLNIGFNKPVHTETNRLKFIINPILEADVKKNFSKLYEDEKWQNNIRGGLKVSWLLGTGTLNFWGKGGKGYRKQDFELLRARKYEELVSARTKEWNQRAMPAQNLGGEKRSPSSFKDTTTKHHRRHRKALFSALGTVEADYLESEGAYTRFQTTWISAWGFLPLSPAEYYISPGLPLPFRKEKYALRELNVQLNHLYDWKSIGTFYNSIWLKTFRNNSVNAELMTSVDINQFNQYPNMGDTLNFALIASNKAYTGAYNTFNTRTAFLQVVYFPNVAWEVKPGASIRYEKNWGPYSPVNWRFGLPLTIKGKDKPLTLELQYRLTDVGNYQKKVDHESKKTLGLSLGLPFALLY